jgi:hypothetical protein
MRCDNITLFSVILIAVIIMLDKIVTGCVDEVSPDGSTTPSLYLFLVKVR